MASSNAPLYPWLPEQFLIKYVYYYKNMIVVITLNQNNHKIKTCKKEKDIMPTDH